MIITYVLSDAKLAHATPSQFGAIVAHYAKNLAFHSARVTRNSVELCFDATAAFSTQQTVLEADLGALLDLEPFPCPCQCGAFIAVDPCFRQSGIFNGEMTGEEHDLAKSGNKIAAIKKIRERLACGLKEAKDLCDKFYPYRPNVDYISSHTYNSNKVDTLLDRKVPPPPFVKK